MKAKKSTWNGFSWHADDYSEGEVEHHQFAIRFKTETTANEFKHAVEKLIEQVKNNVKTQGILIIFRLLDYF